ncbi:MAG TPA: GGDEF domain-containing protein [Usitatibacter sp.]|nr:GGDEF domain-containing protein [Usitatibacter sp.]
MIRILPSRARLAGLGLAFAAVTIAALAITVLLDLDRDATVHREVILAQGDKDELHALRAHLLELRSAARLAARTGEPGAFRLIERRAVDTENELARLEKRADEGADLPGIAALASTSRMLVMHARSVEGMRVAHGAEMAIVLAQRAEALSVEAGGALDAVLASVTQRINERTERQLEVGERLRRYITGLLVVAAAVLGALYVGYRRVQSREREAQRRIEYLAHFDTVTGLPNRALLADRLAQELARARRASQPFAVLLFDLDGFKEVNDTWGHAAGDKVLSLVGERARKCVRASDTVGRLGGDEFLAILPETAEPGAVGVADKLREALREPYLLEGATARLSASVGVSLHPTHGEDAESLQRAADAALYTAKRDGKDKTRVAPAPRESASARRSAA